jgi:hypothetical protein
MSTNTYKWISGILAVVVIGLLVFIFTRPKQVDTVVLSNDLAQFTAAFQKDNAAYTANPTPAGQTQLSQDLGTFATQLKSFQ